MGAFTYRLSGRAAPITVADYRERARRAVPGMVWAYVDHGAESESTLRANRDAFGRYSLRSRVLTGRAPRNLSTEVAGRTLSLPVLLAPTGLTGLTHWTGELGAARGAERAGMCASRRPPTPGRLRAAASAAAARTSIQAPPFLRLVRRSTQ